MSQTPDNLCLGCMQPKGEAAICASCGWDGHGAESVLHLPPGTILNETYLIGRALGQGGFGITYIAWDMKLCRKVAIKEYFPQTLASRHAGQTIVVPTSGKVQEDFHYGLRSFMTEGRILARFGDHPCIVSVLNLFEENQTAYMVMGFLEGMTLAQYLAGHGGKIPFNEALRIMTPVMDGLREVHAQGLLHRDISPDNIYMTRQGPVKILDFGAARFAATERSQSLSVVLKPGYAPEEQYRRNGKQGPWTDVYTAAATIYRCITGAPPPEALDRLAEETLQSPKELGCDIPAAANAAMGRALSIRAEQRYRSMLEFEKALGCAAPGVCEEDGAWKPAVAAMDPTTAQPVSRQPAAEPSERMPAKGQGKRTWMIAAAVAVIALLLGSAGAGVVVVRNRSREAAAQALALRQKAEKEELARQEAVRLEHEKEQARIKAELAAARDEQERERILHEQALAQEKHEAQLRAEKARLAESARLAELARVQEEQTRQIEAARLAQERAREEAARLEAERQRIAKAEQERLAREEEARRAEQERIAADNRIRAGREEAARKAALREREQANRNPNWRFSADNNTYKIQNLDNVLRIIPLGSGLEAELPIKKNNKGQVQIMGQWQVGSSHGFLLIQQFGETLVSGYMLVPAPGAPPDSCLSRTSAFFSALNNGMNQKQAPCQRMNVTWTRQ